MYLSLSLYMNLLLLLYMYLSLSLYMYSSTTCSARVRKSDEHGFSIRKAGFSSRGVEVPEVGMRTLWRRQRVDRGFGMTVFSA